MENGTTELPSEEKKKKRINPNLLSRIFICWMCPVLVNGNRRPVEEEDLIVPNKKFDSERLGLHLQKYWLEEVTRAVQQNREPSLLKAMVRAFWLTFLPAGILVFVTAMVRIVQPLLFAKLLTYWSINSPLSQLEAGYYAFGMIALNFISALCHHHSTLFISQFSLKVKVACTALLYRKIMRINQVSMGEVAAGKIVNIMSNDVARFDYSFMFLHHIWIIPLQAAVVLYLMYNAAGYAPFVGIFGVLILLFPIQLILTKLTSVMRRKTAQRSDKRIQLMTEIINGIQVIKMYAWEKPFEKLVSAARAYEMSALKKSLYVRCTMLGFTVFTERTIIFLTSLFITLSGSFVTAAVIYPIQQFISIIQINLSMILPFAITGISEMQISIQRIQSCLIIDEREDLALSPVLSQITSKPNHEGRISIGADSAIKLTDVSASWINSSKEVNRKTLANILMNVHKGMLCGVIGPVGSGKSSLLQVLLKELPIQHGYVKVNGTVSYACQESWLFPATVRENILFGLPYDAKKYKEICKVCALLPDFKQFPYGDKSLVGERGVSLSGGQKARINLARAVYRDADIYLLDDPLSAVDANVGRLLFDGCIRGYLCGRTVILVTHQIHFLKEADIIVVLNDGAIEDIGSFHELQQSGKAFSILLTRNSDSNEKSEESNNRPTYKRGMSSVSAKSEQDTIDQEQTVDAEKVSSGRLKLALLLQYLGAVKNRGIIFMSFGAILMTQVGATSVDYWLSYWTNKVEVYEQTLAVGEKPNPSWNTQIGELTIGQYLLIYGGLVGLVIIMTQIRIVMFVTMAMRASQNLHDMIFGKLITAMMRFFDFNPSGRVLNRFSKDLGAMDELLPRAMIDAMQMYLVMLSILILTAIVLPWTLIPAACLITIFVLLLRWYLNTSQQVKRLEGSTKSPVFNMINSTISGISTIRSSNSQKRLMKTFDEAQDLHTSSYFTFVGGTAAFSLYLDILCLIYLTIILTIFIAVDFGSTMSIGSVGLAVSQSLGLTIMLQMAARLTADFLAQMTAVERLMDYTKLPSETNAEVGVNEAPRDWPPKGKLQFANVNFMYDEYDRLVLKNLNFEIKERWKVGVVGRTGAGKSSLISALFRLYKVEGNIKIDDIDTIGLSKTELRSKISIIPQEPVLFSGTIRYNLDPFDVYTDDNLWRALEQVELKDVIPNLYFKVSEGGSNFSVGQRQLICLARAILRSNKILVMDEATANVDPQTDALIQKTIRREFASCTVITIAHRLNTIMDSDRVLVMDKGLVAEYDHPYRLLQNTDSILSFMVKETGDGMMKTLKEVARNKYFMDYPNEEP